MVPAPDPAPHICLHRAALSTVNHWNKLLTSSARTGKKMIIVAVLLANSVNKAMTIVMRMTATGGGTPSRGCRRPPIQTDRPDSCGRESKQAGEWGSCISAQELILSKICKLHTTFTHPHNHLCCCSAIRVFNSKQFERSCKIY